MKLKLYFIAFLFLSIHSLKAQTNDLQDVWQRQMSTQKTGMYVLSGWSVANIAVSGIAVGQAEGSTKHFHEMNIYWNVVNLGIAGLGFLAINKQKSQNASLANVIDVQHSLEKTLLFNSGLDLAYMASGAYLIEKGKNQIDITDKNRQKGFGQSILVQGGFLLVFDVTNYFLHQSNNRKIKRILEKVDLSSNGVSIRL